MRRRFLLSCALVVSFVLVAVACGGDDDVGSPAPETPDASTADVSNAGPDIDASPGTEGGATGCGRAAKADDRVRKVVVSHPFESEGAQGKKFEVLELSVAGELTKTNEVFEMGNALSEIVFTPDGEVGLVAQKDGTIGVFGFDAAGKVRVIHAAFKGAFFAQHIVVSPNGERAWVIDSNTKENGGGVYELAIACDGTLSSVGLAVPADVPYAMALVPTNADEALLIARGAFDSPTTDYAHLLQLTPTPPKRLRGGAVFTGAPPVVSWVSVTPDGKWGLVTDDNIEGGDRMAAIALETMKASAELAIKSPQSSVISPFGNAALVASGEDALVTLKYDPANAAVPFTVTGEVAYTSGKPKLPGITRLLDRGTLKGRVLVAEVSSVRQLTFTADGAVTDLNKPFVFSDELPDIVGSLGVQP